MADGTRETMRMASTQYGGRRASRSIRDFEFKDFAAAIAFVNRVADAAEEANHHPDILVHGWNKVRLTLTTHSEGGLTDNDRAMAERIDGARAVPLALLIRRVALMNDDDSSRSSGAPSRRSRRTA